MTPAAIGWQLTKADVEAIAEMVQHGRSIHQVSNDLQISEQMVICALRLSHRHHRIDG